MNDEKEIDLERISLRKDPSIPIVVVREHLIRYVFALDSVVNKDVLDIACASGYGMYLMSYWAKSVSGYDYNQEAIDEASKFNYKCEVCLEVKNLDKIKTLANDKIQKFDVVTCFETLEHLVDPKRLVGLIKEVLNANAVVYFSTPNKLDSIDGNVWHKTAFNVKVMQDVLTRNFSSKIIQIWGMNQWGISDDLEKPYLIVKAKV